MLFPLLLALAQTTAAPPAPPPVDCTDADHRAFDFWIGEWNVFPTGATTRIARSRIEKIAGCAISESFDQDIGPGGKPISYRGRSISAYVPADRRWRQFYIDSGGRAVTLDGGIENGAMVLTTGTGQQRNRMIFTRQPDGSVTQRGAASTDSGKTWTPGFDFTYRKRS